MIVVVAALKGGVGKTTTAVYLSAVAGGGEAGGHAGRQRPAGQRGRLGRARRRRGASSRSTWSRRPPSGSWRKTLDRVDGDDVAVVDTPPGHERLLAKALERADVVVIPTRVGGVETARVEAVLDMVPKRLPAGLVFARPAPSPVTTRTRRHVAGGGRAGVGHGARAGGASPPGPTAGCRPRDSRSTATSCAGPDAATRP